MIHQVAITETPECLPFLYLPKRIFLFFQVYLKYTNNRKELDKFAFKLAARTSKISLGIAFEYWHEGLKTLNMYEDYFLDNVDKTFALGWNTKAPSYPWKKKLDVYREFCNGVPVKSIAYGYKLSQACVEAFIKEVNKRKQKDKAR